jgi:hypothetical protein
MQKRILFLALMSAMSSAYSLDTTVDPRSLGMAGAGVASSNGLNALYQNPGALSGLSKEKFTLEFPVAARFLDESNLQNKLDALNTSATSLSSAMSAFQAAPSQANAGAASTALTNFNNAMTAVSNKSLMGSLYLGGILAIPKPTFSFALKVDGRAEFAGAFNYASADQTQITTLSNNLNACSTNLASCTTLAGVDATGQITNLASDFKIRGVVIGEVGLTAARRFEEWGAVDIGITPKFMKITSFDVVAAAQSGNTNSNTTSGNTQTDTAFNLDVGAVKTYQVSNGNVVRAGVVAKNVISKTLKTQLGNAIELAPQVTLGGAFGNNWYTGTVDVDLIKNKALIPGFTQESQFVRVGGEFDAAGWAQVRLGYRHDLAGNYSDLPSIGLGLNLKVVNIDLSVAAASKKEMAAALQVGTHF